MLALAYSLWDLGVYDNASLMFYGETPDGRLGNSNALEVADINSDGVDDIIVGAYFNGVWSVIFSGRVYAVFTPSGGYKVRSAYRTNQDGVYPVEGPGVNYVLLQDSWRRFGTSVNVGDVNGDGNLDLIVGGDHRFYTHGSTLAIGTVDIFEGPFSANETRMGYNWDGDFSDANENFYVSILGYFPACTVSSYGMYNGQGGYFGGYWMNPTGDADGDGRDDLLVWEPFRARVYKYYNGTNLFSYNNTYTYLGGLYFITGANLTSIASSAKKLDLRDPKGGVPYPYDGPDGIKKYGIRFTAESETTTPKANYRIAQPMGIYDLNGDGKGELIYYVYNYSGRGAIFINYDADSMSWNWTDSDGNIDILEDPPVGNGTLSSMKLLRILFPSGHGSPSISGVYMAMADVNGDGVKDFIVTFPWADYEGSNSGAILIWDGTRSTLTSAPSSPKTVDADVNFIPDYIVHGSVFGSSSYMGADGLAASDIDGDGKADLAVASDNYQLPGKTGVGEVVIIYGKDIVANAPEFDLDNTTARYYVFRGVNNEARFGSAVKFGDVIKEYNSEGIPELVVGARLDVGWNLAVNGGNVYVFEFIPLPPENLTVARSEESPYSSVALQWDDSTPLETAWQIWRSEDNSTWTLIATLPENSTSYVDSGLEEYRVYHYRVKPVNELINATDPDSGRWAYGWVRTALRPPGNLTLSKRGDTWLYVSWVDNSTKEEGYKVQLSNDNISWFEVQSLPANSVSANITSLQDATSYYLRVLAYNSTASPTDSTPSNVLVSSTRPYAPSSLNFTADSVSQVSLFWTDVSSRESGYAVYVNGTLKSLLPINSTSATLTGLSEGCVYNFTIMAYFDGAGGRVYSYPVSTLGGPKPNPPSSLDWVSYGEDWIYLNWTDNSSSNDGYYLQYYYLNGTLAGSVSLGDVNETNVTSLLSGTSYVFKLRAYVSATGVYSDYTEAEFPTAPAPVDYFNITSSYGQISLSWSYSGSSDGFLIYKRKESEFSFTQVGSVNTGYYTDTSVDEATVYYYRVVPFKKNSSGTETAYASYVENVTASVPASPSGVQAEFSDDMSNVTVTWVNNSSGADGVIIERKIDNNLWVVMVTLDFSGGAVSSWVDTNGGSPFVEGEEYYYRLRSYKDFPGGTVYSSYSDEAMATSKPAAPSLLQAVPFSQSAISLSWQDNSAKEENYFVELSEDNSTWTQIASLPFDSTSYLVTGLESGKRYYFRVRCVRNDVYSDYSNVAFNSTKPAPVDSVSYSVEFGKVTLTWSHSYNRQFFRIYRKREDETSFSVVGETTDTTFADTTVDESYLYSYYVVAVSDDVESDPSSTVTVVAPPDSVSNLEVEVIDYYTVKLTWKDNSDMEDGFRIYRLDGYEGDFKYITSLPANTTEFTDNTLKPEVPYTYRIITYRGVATSKPAEVFILATYLNKPTNLVLSLKEGKKPLEFSIELRWTDNSNAERNYEIQMDDGSGWKTLELVDRDTTVYTYSGVRDIDRDRVFKFRVRALSSGVSSEWSDEKSVTVKKVSLVQPGYSGDEARAVVVVRNLFNPSQGEMCAFVLNPVGGGVEDASIEILSLKGRVLWRWTSQIINRTVVYWDGGTSFGDAPPGIYLVRIRVGDITTWRKVGVVR